MNIFIGFDPREAAAYAVARHSLRRHLSEDVPVRGLILRELIVRGLYRRPEKRQLGKIWDVISGAYASTEFANSRFLVPQLVKAAAPKGQAGWALFVDCDMLFRADAMELFRLAHRNPQYALMCVKHKHAPVETVKMDGQVQAVYPRKNWTSVMMINCDHQSNDNLTDEMINELPGRDLHGLCWLDDDEIGELPQEWNYLVGETLSSPDPKLVHFTAGGPWFSGFENVEFADEWRSELERWAA